MLKRWLEEKLRNALKERRIVILSGSRQCGKSTLSKSLKSNNFIYRTLDDHAFLLSAQNDPSGFIKLKEGTMIIDEIQKAPVLISEIKKAVDENTRYGQYLLTGSVNIQTLPTAKESLAGRVKRVRLRPFAQGEIFENKPDFLNRLKNNDYKDNTNFDKETVLNLAFRGGYPETLHMKKKAYTSWYRDYLNTIIEYDLKDISNIKRQDYLKTLFEIICSYSSKFIDKSKITSSLGFANQTLDVYLGVLENTYLIDKLPPYLKTDYERVNKQHKYFVSDTGLMASVLGWNIDELFLDADKSGKIFETFVYHQIISQIESNDDECSLFHYRDREKREIDFIIQNNNNIYGIEVKAGSSISKEHFKHLIWFRDNLAKDKNFKGIVLYTGENSVSFGKNLYAVPINNLWE